MQYYVNQRNNNIDNNNYKTGGTNCIVVLRCNYEGMVETIYIPIFKGRKHLPIFSKIWNQKYIFFWLDSTQLDQGLARLSLKHFL